MARSKYSIYNERIGGAKIKVRERGAELQWRIPELNSLSCKLYIIITQSTQYSRPRCLERILNGTALLEHLPSPGPS